jgi:formylglycine-generating enzyme required for sulfatase activity
VHAVLWQEARDYCAWAGLRLPTEVEWEVAARGGQPGEFPWGAAMPTDDGPPLCNLEGTRDGFPFTAPVGSFPAGASPFGCLDMAGNVFEWTSDPFTATNDGHERRVFKGGTWNASLFLMRATYRDGSPPGVRLALIGFRGCR